MTLINLGGASVVNVTSFNSPRSSLSPSFSLLSSSDSLSSLFVPPPPSRALSGLGGGLNYLSIEALFFSFSVPSFLHFAVQCSWNRARTESVWQVRWCWAVCGCVYLSVPGCRQPCTSSSGCQTATPGTELLVKGRRKWNSTAA